MYGFQKVVFYDLHEKSILEMHNLKWHEVQLTHEIHSPVAKAHVCTKTTTLSSSGSVNESWFSFDQMLMHHALLNTKTPFTFVESQV